MQSNDDLMSVDDPRELTDDHPLVRASEEGVEWEILTGPVDSASAPAEDRGGDDRSTG